MHIVRGRVVLMLLINVCMYVSRFCNKKTIYQSCTSNSAEIYVTEIFYRSGPDAQYCIVNLI